MSANATHTPTAYTSQYHVRAVGALYFRITRDGSNNIAGYVSGGGAGRRKWTNVLVPQSQTAYLANAPNKIGIFYAANSLAQTFLIEYWRSCSCRTGIAGTRCAGYLTRGRP